MASRSTPGGLQDRPPDPLADGLREIITQLAETEKVDRGNLSRLLLLTLLARDIVTAILDGNQPPALSIFELKKLFPVEWEAQRVLWGFPSASGGG